MTGLRQSQRFNSNESRNLAPGARTTNRRPAKITIDVDDVKVLASNIDTLVLSFDILWDAPALFFAELSETKERAQSESIDIPLSYGVPNPDSNYIFNIKPHGSKGYEWIIVNKEYNMVIGNWKKPQSMPSLVLTIRSETLWRKGPYSAIEFIIDFIKYVGGKIQKIRVSRLDLCIDVLLPSCLWSESLLNYTVTRASYDNTRRNHQQLATIDIGKNHLKARIYDKPLEIQQQSNKTWFYDIWGLNEVPENKKIIRVEFQLRREILKELGIDSVKDLFNKAQNVWAYCTIDWLKFQNNPGKQSHQRKTFGWWKAIQDGFNDIPAGMPLIRAKANQADKDMLSYQIIGLLSSFAALDFNSKPFLSLSDITLPDTFAQFLNYVDQKKFNQIDFSERVANKKAKFQRNDEKWMDSLHCREQCGFLPVADSQISTSDNM